MTVIRSAGMHADEARPSARSASAAPFAPTGATSYFVPMKFSVSIDFNDDMWVGEQLWTAEKLRESITLLHQRGITNIRWVDHGNFFDGLYDPGSGFDKEACATSIRGEMPDPRQVVIDRAHELGMTVTQVLKPWDLAFGSPSLLFPHGKGPQPPVGLPEVGGFGGVCHNWIREHPESIVSLHPSLREPDGPRKPVHTIRLWHEQAALADTPAVTIYTSQDNFTYEPYDGPVTINQSVRRRKPPVFAPAPEKAFGPEGDYACLELTGLQIEAPYIALEWAEPWPLENTLEALVEVEDEAGQPAVHTLGIAPIQPNGKEVDWKQGGIAYDCSRRTPLLRVLLASNSAGRLQLNVADLQVLAIGRGSNDTRGGHVEFADPQVREWLNGLIDDAFDAGCDGIDIRFGSHTECLDYENYGFHPAIVAAYKDRYDVDITTEKFDRAAWRDLRGDFVDQWLGEVSHLARNRGKTMSVHLMEVMDVPSTHRSMYEIAWHWEKWIESGMLDEATFKAFRIGGRFYKKALARCREHNLPVIWKRKPGGSNKQDGWLEAIDIAVEDGLDQFDLYELAIFQKLRADGRLDIEIPYVWQRIAAIQQ